MVARQQHRFQQTVKQQTASFIFCQHCAWIIYELKSYGFAGGELGYHCLQVCLLHQWKWLHHRQMHDRTSPLLIINEVRWHQVNPEWWYRVCVLATKMKRKKKSTDRDFHAARINSSYYALLNFWTLLVKAQQSSPPPTPWAELTRPLGWESPG